MNPVLRGIVHLAALLALAALAAATGRWLRDPALNGDLLALVLAAAFIALALRRLYGRGGIVALRPDPAAPEPVRPRPRPRPQPLATSAPLFPAAPLDDDRIDLNTADAEALQRLPGVGPVAAQRIVAEREAGGPFESVEALERVPGFAPARVRAMADRLRV